MKTATLLLGCAISSATLAQNGISTFTAEGPITKDLEVLVDGKNYAIIPGTTRSSASGSSINISLAAGQHIIKLKPVNEENAVADPPPAQQEVASVTLKNVIPAPNRSSLIQKQIFITAEERDSIKVELYDNGVIDGDTVTLFRDNRLVAQNQRLSNTPVVFYTSLDKGQKVQLLKMEAQNLGAITPNTALMIVTTRKARYNVPLSGDMTRNAVVELLLKE